MSFRCASRTALTLSGLPISDLSKHPMVSPRTPSSTAQMRAWEPETTSSRFTGFTSRRGPSLLAPVSPCQRGFRERRFSYREEWPDFRPDGSDLDEEPEFRARDPRRGSSHESFDFQVALSQQAL